MANVNDETNTTVTLTNGDTETLEVNTDGATHVIIMVDNGTTDTAAAAYDLERRAYSEHMDAWMKYAGDTTSTAFSHVDRARPSSVQVELTNNSGGSADYRIRVLAVNH